MNSNSNKYDTKENDLEKEIISTCDNDDPLDYFIEKPKIQDISNPFFKSSDDLIKLSVSNTFSDTIQTITELNATQIAIRRVILICSKANVNIPEKIYDKNVTSEELSDICQYLMMIPCSTKILKNEIHKNTLLFLSKNILSRIEQKNTFELQDFEIVIPFFDMEYNTVETYAQMYGPIECDYNKLYEILALKKIFNVPFKIDFDYISNILHDYYWRYSKTEFNMTKIFDKRNIRLLKDTDKSIQTDYNFVESNLYKCDIYTAMKNSETRTFYVKDPTYYMNNINYDFVTQMFNSCNDEYTMFNLFNAFAVSKQHAHLVVNNKEVMHMMKPLFEKYKLIYSNILTYPMLTFYIEECLFGTKVQPNNRYLISIDTAHEYPIFPVSMQFSVNNPYVILPINQTFINRLFGMLVFSNYKYYGIDNLEGFRKKLNIFTSGQIDKNIFNGIDWNSFVITGSAIPACVPTRSPLVDKVSNLSEPYEIQFIKFFKEYYSNSDIDIICTKQDYLEFINSTYEFVGVVKKNLGLQESDDKIISTPVKLARIFINLETLEEHLKILKQKYPQLDQIKNIKKEIGTNEILRQYFYELYLKYKTLKFQNMKPANILQKQFFDPITKENLRIYIFDKKQSNITSSKLNSDVIYIEKKKDIENNNFEYVVFKIEETIRYKISDNPSNPINEKYLHRPFEIFKSDSSVDAFSTVARFHLPCVRGYYNGNDVRMTPSCVFSHLTLMNIDYRYFAGTAKPNDIILKYHHRGYGLILNNNEARNMKIFELNVKLESSLKQYTEFKKITFNDLMEMYNCTTTDIHNRRDVFNKFGNVLPFNNKYCEEQWKNINKK